MAPTINQVTHPRRVYVERVDQGQEHILAVDVAARHRGRDLGRLKGR